MSGKLSKRLDRVEAVLDRGSMELVLENGERVRLPQASDLFVVLASIGAGDWPHSGVLDTLARSRPMADEGAMTRMAREVSQQVLSGEWRRHDWPEGLPA